ncbi:MAG: NADH-quinone oxidoreductase subunit NuoN [Magnetococcales bacterium]|nr:NADH-quinone oxidoreductase subunit NuoN [Magnetococcales bacterium]
MPVPMPDINLIALLPEILILLVAMGVLLLTAWSRETTQPLLGLVAMAGVALAGGILLIQTGMTTTTFGGLFVLDPFASAMKLLMLVATLLPLLMSWDYLARHRLDIGEYFVLTLFALLGGMLMASSGDFITLYLGLELMSLSIYVLAAFNRDDPKSNEAGLKYFVLGSMASGLLLYGISLIYGGAGGTGFAAVAQAMGEGGGHAPGIGLRLGVVLVLAGMAFKIAAAPFHMWAPDVYQGAPTSVTAFMAAMPKIAGFAAIYRVLLEPFGPMQSQWGPILQFLAVASLAVGALAAIAQTNIKRMLAYSSIGHVGYALIGLASGTELGFRSVLIYLAIYIFMNLGTFALILVVNNAGVGDEINDYRGLAKKRPLLAFLMAIFMFAMAGIPPLAGFIGKFYVFMAAVKAGMIGLAVTGVLFSAVGAYYYLRVVQRMYFEEAETAFRMEVGLLSRLVIAVSTLAVLYWGLLPGGLIDWAEASIRPLL